jgi:hypothetical protein
MLLQTGCIEEHFITFIVVQERTPTTLMGTVLRELQSLGLSINDCYGQDYDSGANMFGMNSGLKTKIFAINPRASFTACGCHNWNLLLDNASR